MKAWWSAWQQTAKLFGAHRKLWVPFLVVLVVEVLLIGLVWLAPHPPFADLLAPPIRFFFGDRVLHYPAHLWFLYHVTKHTHLVASLLVGAFMTGVACAMVRQLHQGHALVLRDVLINKQVRYGRVLLVWVVTWAMATGLVTLALRVLPQGPVGLAAAVGCSLLLQTLFAYAIPAAVFEARPWWRALWQAIREAARYPFSTLGVIIFPSLIIVGISILAAPTRVAQWMGQTVPEIAVVCVAVRLVLWTLADVAMSVAIAHLWWIHRLPARAPVKAAKARTRTAGVRAPSLACALTALLAMSAVSSGCSVNYNGERLFWKAQQLSGKIVADVAAATPEQFTEAALAYERVIAKAPGTMWAGRAQLSIGSLFAMQKQYDKAREAYRLVLQNYNQYKEYGLASRLAIARSYEVEEKWDEAIAVYQEISEYYSWSAMGLEAPLYVARIHELRKQADEAKRAYGRAMRMYTRMLPDAPTPEMATQLKGYLALAHQRLGQWDEAIGLLQELAAMEKGVNRPLVLITLASIYQTKKSDREHAGELYTKLLEEFPEHPFGKVARAQLEQLGLPVPAAVAPAAPVAPVMTPQPATP